MRRADLEHVIRAVAANLGVQEVVVLGSQAILGTYPEWQLPREATRSIEADIAVDVAVGGSDFATRIAGPQGQDSDFHRTFGYYADGVEIVTATLVEGWRDRLVPVVVDIPGGTVVGWCLGKEDLWVAKAAAGRAKDVDFCSALARDGLVDRAVCESFRDLVASERERRSVSMLIVRAFGD